MNIVTGYRGEAHVSSSQMQALNRSVFGNESYVSQEGSQLAATLISANEVRISDGTIFLQGVQAEIPANTYESVTLENGAQGMNRKDLIVARYTKNASTHVEQVSLYVIQGTSTSGVPTAPIAISGNIREGDLIVDMPLYLVTIEDVNVTAVSPVFSTTPDITGIMGNLETLFSVVNFGICDNSTKVLLGTGDTMLLAYCYNNSNWGIKFGKEASVITLSHGSEDTGVATLENGSYYLQNTSANIGLRYVAIIGTRARRYSGVIEG